MRWWKVCVCNNLILHLFSSHRLLQKLNYIKKYLTGAIFETGASGVQSKSQKPFIWSGVVQKLSPGKGAFPSTSTTLNPIPGAAVATLGFMNCIQNKGPLFWIQFIKPSPALDFLFFSELSSRNPFTTTWYQCLLVRTWLSSINWQNKLQKCSKLKFLKF